MRSMWSKWLNPGSDLRHVLAPIEILSLVPEGPGVKCGTKARLAQVSLPLVYP